MPIYFYNLRDAFGCFSNFSAHGVELNGKWWPTSEHYFQAQKFVGTPHEEDLRLAKTPKQVAEMGRDRRRPLRPDWEQVKDDVMRVAVRQKFHTHADLQRTLLDTGEEVIVENAPGDYYWGVGADGSGKNMLGQILMQVRDELRIEGTWQLVSALTDGTPMDSAVVNTIRVVIHNAIQTVFIGDEVVAHDIPFNIDSTVTPKAVTDRLPDGQTIRGIYLLEGDILTSCVAAAGQERPAAFVSTPGSGYTLRVFRRVLLP